MRKAKYNRKLLPRILSLVLFLAVLLLAASSTTVWYFGTRSVEPAHADAAIVLGAAINSEFAANRALKAYDLCQAGKVSMVVMSGGKISDKDQSEAEYMEKVFINQKKQTSCTVILEKNSRNTEENIAFSRKLIPEAKTVTIVSDEYHLARGVLMAKSAGFDYVTWVAASNAAYTQKALLWHYGREVVGLLWYLPDIFHLKKSEFN